MEVTESIHKSICKEIPDRLNSKREPVRRKKFLSHNLVDETGRFLRKDVSGEAQDSAGELRINAPDAASAEINGVMTAPARIAAAAQKRFGRVMCWDCVQAQTAGEGKHEEADA